MNSKVNIHVYINGNSWNYYRGYVVYEKVDWMVPKEYYKDNVYRHTTNSEGLIFDDELYSKNKENMKYTMKDYGDYCRNWSTESYPIDTDESVGVYLDLDNPHFSTEADKQAYEEYCRDNLSRFD